MSEGKKVENLREVIDTLKIRIEEKDRNYFSLRDLEWRTTLQVLTFYAAIGISHFNLFPQVKNPAFLTNWCVFLSIAVFALYFFLSICIQQRLWATRDDRNLYIARLHEVVGEPKHTDEGKLKPMAPYWYAFVTQLLFHILAVITLILFIMYARA
jgi:hypothetical protein